MNLTKLAVNRPVTILMLVLGLAVLGAVSYGYLPVRELPDIPQPDIEITTLYPGATPSDVRRLVTGPLESGLELVNGMTQMTSLSTQGQSTLLLRFAAGVSPDTAASDVAQAIHRVSGKLPREASLPTIVQHNPSDLPVIQIALGGKLSPGQLAQYATGQLFPALQSVPGVAGISLTGTVLPQVDVTVDPASLSAFGITLDEISRALVSQNATVSGGSVQNGANAYLTSTSSPFTSVSSLGKLTVGVRKNASGIPEPVKLSQVAEISEGLSPARTMTMVNGDPAVGISIGVQSGEYSLTVEKEVIKTLQQAKKGLPPGVTLSVVGDRTLETRAALHAVVLDLAIAILLTSAVLYAFLRRAAHTFIVLFAIPSSLIATFAVMYALGFSLDLMSLLGLSLLIGILVDDSIVVLENIDRRLEAGDDPATAAIRGRMEIGAAAVAITLTDVVVYAPVAFVHGTVGALFREFGLTITAATLFSLFISFTLTPMLASRWLKPGKMEKAAGSRDAMRGGMGREENPGPLLARYGKIVRRALERRRTVAAIAAASLLLSLLFVPLGLVKTAFLPDRNSNIVQIDASLPAGTALTETGRIIDGYIAALRRAHPETDVFAVIGQAADGTLASSSATISMIRAADRRKPSSEEMIDTARSAARQYPGLEIATELPNPLVKGGTPPVDVSITGPDPAVLAELGREAAGELKSVRGLEEVTNHAAGQAPEWHIQLDEQKAVFFRLNTSQVGQAVQNAVQGNVVTTLQASGQAVAENIFLRLKNGDRLDADQLKSIPIAVQGGRTIALSDVASVTLEPGPVQLAESNRMLAVHVTANLHGLALGQAAARVDEALKDLRLPAGYHLVTGGEISDQKLAFGPLTLAFVLSLILIYMLMAALYESFVTPMVVLCSLPLATVGAFLLLLLTGQSLNVFSFIAMIMLMGLVAKNAILLVDRGNALIRQGMERTEALVQAGRNRLRPILMTTATLVISMLPLALDRGSGAEDRVSVAVVLIGGMLSSTLLTLIVVPVLYTFFDDLRSKLRTARMRIRRQREADAS